MAGKIHLLAFSFISGFLHKALILPSWFEFMDVRNIPYISNSVSVSHFVICELWSSFLSIFPGFVLKSFFSPGIYYISS